MELFYLDTGGSGYANVSTISAEVHPILYNTPQQALQCSLAGIEMASIIIRMAILYRGGNGLCFFAVNEYLRVVLCYSCL